MSEAEKFVQKLKNAHIDLNTFLKLFLSWHDLTVEQKSEVARLALHD